MSFISQLVNPSTDEIEELFQKAEDGLAEGSQFPGMSYEEGILDTLRWLWEAGDNPLSSAVDTPGLAG